MLSVCEWLFESYKELRAEGSMIPNRVPKRRIVGHTERMMISSVVGFNGASRVDMLADPGPLKL